MSQLHEKLNDIKNRTKLLLDEIEKLNDEILELEQYNQRLIYENQQIHEVVESPTKAKKANALLDMYHRGYHICTNSFSKPLEDKMLGCMYCYEVLERNRGEQIIESTEE